MINKLLQDELGHDLQIRCVATALEIEKRNDNLSYETYSFAAQWDTDAISGKCPGNTGERVRGEAFKFGIR